MTHLSQISNVTEDIEICKKVRWFLEVHFLDWVENLVSEGQLSIAVVKLQKVDLCLPVKDNSKLDISNTLQASIREAHLFLRLHQLTNTPKNVHVYNTILFCPKESIIRKTWMPKVFPWVAAPLVTDQHWDRDFNALRGHEDEDWVFSIAFSHDGKLMASGYEYSVRIWDTDMGTTQHTFKITEAWGLCIDWVYCVAFSTRGTVAAGLRDSSIILWDSATGRQLKRLRGQSGIVNAICFSISGSKLATASSLDVRIWDLDRLDTDTDTYKFDDIKGHSHTIRCVAFSGNEKLLATGSDDTKIRVWDVETRELRSTFEGHTEQINSIVFSPNMKLIASGSQDGTSGIWDAESITGKRLQTLKSTPHSEVISVEFSPNGLHLASATKKAIDIWDSETGGKLQVLAARSFDTGSAAFSPSGAYIASGSIYNDCTVHLWNAVGRPEDSKPPKQLGDGREIQEIAISPDGRIIAAVQVQGTVSLWDIDKNEILNPKMEFEHDDYRPEVYSLMFSPNDGKMLLSSSEDGSVRVCVVASGKRIHLFLGHTARVRCATWSADGAYIASASDDSSIRIWKIGSKEDENPAVIHHAHGQLNANTVAFSPDGKYIVSGGSDYKVVVWERKQDDTWKQTRILGCSDSIVGVAISPDCKCVVSSSLDKTLRIWDIEKDKSQPPIKIERGYEKLWFDQRSSDYVMTTQGFLYLSPSSSSSQPPPWCPYRISYDEEQKQWWITWGDKKVIFLPEIFGPTFSHILGDRIITVTSFGEVNVYGFSKDIAPVRNGLKAVMLLQQYLSEATCNRSKSWRLQFNTSLASHN